MRAALLVAFEEPFVVEDIDDHDPAPGGVLLRTGASPFCSTDCVKWRGGLGKVPPIVLGHASMGEVLEVGAGVTHVRPGQRAIVPGTSECGTCFYCSIGRPDQCSETFDRDGIWPHVTDRRDGQPVSAAVELVGVASPPRERGPLAGDAIEGSPLLSDQHAICRSKVRFGARRPPTACLTGATSAGSRSAARCSAPSTSTAR